MSELQAKGHIVQVGTNNYVFNYNNSPTLITSSSTQTSIRHPTKAQPSEAPLVVKDMNGNMVELHPGDPLWAEYDLDMANAVYIGGAVCACVRGQKVAKERLYTIRFRKMKVQFKPRVDVFNLETACRRAREQLNACFKYGTSEDFVSWCYTGHVSSEVLA